MNQLFYNIAGGIVHQIRRDKRIVKRIETALMPSLLFRCVSLFFSFLSSPREKVAKLSSFWDWWEESLQVVSSIVAKYNIFPRANNGRSHEKTKILAKRFGHAISVHYRDFEHAYVYTYVY